MYGVLYAISPEIFPAKDRGTGNGLVSTATRVFGVLVRDPRFHDYFYREQRLTHLITGTHNCTVCQYNYFRSGLHFWWFIIFCRVSGAVVAIRT